MPKGWFFCANCHKHIQRNYSSSFKEIGNPFCSKTCQFTFYRNNNWGWAQIALAIMDIMSEDPNRKWRTMEILKELAKTQRLDVKSHSYLSTILQGMARSGFLLKFVPLQDTGKQIFHYLWKLKKQTETETAKANIIPQGF